MVVLLDSTIAVQRAFQMVLVVKNPPANAGDMRLAFNPWVGKIPLRRARQPTLVFLPWRIPWEEEPGGPQCIGSQRVGHN